jgi:hypothetical protein
LTRLILYFICFCLSWQGFSQNSVLSTGKWFKLSVKADGIYQIDYELLKSLGANPDGITPSTIKLYGYPNGMLPQANSAPRQKDLKEMAILVLGEADGKFNQNDKIFFYGQGPDAHYYDDTKKTFWYENHLYTDKNYYFLTVDGAAGKRLASKESVPGTFPIVNQYLDFAQFEEDKENILHSGREWFGFEFDSQTEATIQFEMEGVVDNSPVTFISKVMARAFAPLQFKIFYNNIEIGSQSVATVANTTYSAKGRMKSDTLRLNSSAISAASGSLQRIKYQFVKSGTEHSVGYLDNFLVSLKREIALYGDQTIFTLSEGLTNTTSSVEVNTGSSGISIWDVTDPFSCKNQAHQITGAKANFNTESNSLKKFAVFNSTKAMALPTGEGIVANQNLQSLGAANFLIIAHADFEEAASRLGAHRLSHNGLTTRVVTPQQIYNEYSGGKQDVSALRDFIRDMFLKSNSTLKYVLLFGRGSYDYKNRNSGNTNFVPVYESRNSLSPLETYSSDDFYGFLEENEGFWSEANSFNHTLDVSVGRLPVRTKEEATTIVNKLIEYDLNKRVKGQWKTDIAFVADDGDFNIHQSQADQLANYVETLNPSLHAKKIYLDLFHQQTKPFGQLSPDATNSLYRAFQEGALIINFTGHGSEQQWMQERMLDPVFVADTKNRFRYPFVITATCEFGRNDDPLTISSAEKLLLKKEAGAIGLVTTSRPVSSATNFEINSDFYESFLIDTNSKGKPIGTVFQVTKNKGNLGVANRNFSLLGDPSMTVGVSQNEIVITELTNSTGESDLQGLTQYSLRGEVRNSGLLKNDFNGEAEIRIFSKPNVKRTLGDENPIFQYNESDKLLFQGRATITDGQFDMDFIVPRISEASLSQGKLVVYATSDDSEEAAGSFAVTVSPINNELTDNITPTAQLYINDTTFINGGITNEDPILIAQLQDNIGFDVTGNDEVKIEALLDGDTTFNLSAYLISNTNNAKKGSIRFQLFDLSQGEHHVTLTFFDVAGNKGTADVDFTVGELNQLEISEVIGWPNPFSEKVKIGFLHNRSGEDLRGSLVITSVYGKPVRVIEFESLNSSFNTEFMEWDGTDYVGSKVAPGVYILHLSLRSLVDGSKNQAITKLILSN